MDFEKKPMETVRQEAGDNSGPTVTGNDPSPTELLNFLSDTDNDIKFPTSSSNNDNEHLLNQHNPKKNSDDFEHVDPYTDHYNTVRDKIDSQVHGKLAAVDDLLTDAKKQFDDKKTDFGMEFSNFGNQMDKIGSDLMSGFEQNVANTKDFMAAERGGGGGGGGIGSGSVGQGYNISNIEKPTAPVNIAQQPTAPYQTTKSTIDNNKSDDDDDEEYFNDSYNPSPSIKQPFTNIEKNTALLDEKLLLSDDLLGDFIDQRDQTIPENKPAGGGHIDFSLPKQDELFNVPKELPKMIEKPIKTVVEDRPSMPPPAIPSSRIEDIKEPTPAKVTPPPPPAKIEKKKSEERPQMIQAEEMFYKIGLVESLIYWRDVKKSGIVCGAGLIILLAISCFSAISVIAYLSLLTLFGTIAFRIYKNVLGAIQKTSDGHPFKEYLETDLTLSQDKVQQICTVAVAHVNAFVSELRRLFLVEDLIDSLKFGFILWVLTYIGSWFNGMTLVILAFIALFTLPKVYEQNKQIIDQNLDIVKSKFLEITDKIKVALPIGKKPTETDKEK